MGRGEVGKRDQGQEAVKAHTDPTHRLCVEIYTAAQTPADITGPS